MALQTAYKEAEPLRQIMVEELKLPTQLTLFCDNTSALAVIKNGNYNNTVCIEYVMKNRLKVIRESGCALNHVTTQLQPADGLTKPLLGQKQLKNLNTLFHIK